MLSERQRRILIRATELIGIKGSWIKGSLYGTSNRGGLNTDKYCALGAINRAAFEEENKIYPTHAELSVAGALDFGHVTRAVAAQIPGQCKHNIIPVYNDNPKTTHAEIKDIFCKAVKAELGED